MVSPSKMPSTSFLSLVRRNSFGIGHAGSYDSSRAAARGERISMPCAPSPPSTFCQEKVTTSSFFHGRSIANAADVASQIVSPSRSSAIQSPLGTRTPEVVPFHTKTMSCVGSVFGEVGQHAVIRLDRARVLQLELLHHIGDPVLAEALPREHVDGFRSQAATTAPFRRRRCPTRRRSRCGSPRARPAPCACGRSRLSASPCRALSGANARDTRP